MILLSSIWLREQVGWIRTSGLAVGFGGIVLVIGAQGIGIDGVDRVGLGFCFASLLGISIGAVMLLMWLIRNGEAAKVASLFYLV